MTSIKDQCRHTTILRAIDQDIECSGNGKTPAHGYIFAEPPLPSLLPHTDFQLSTNYMIRNFAMDELYWDIFRFEHEIWDDALFISEAQELVRRCPCNRSDAFNPCCVRCKLLSLFARSQISNNLPREPKSSLEIVSSPANRTSSRWSEHRTDVVITSPTEALDEEESEDLPFEWDGEREHGIYDVCSGSVLLVAAMSSVTGAKHTFVGSSSNHIRAII